MKQILVKKGSTINLGRRGENKARKIFFDITEWKELYGIGRAELLAQRSEDDVPYPVPLSENDVGVVWTVTASDTAQSNYGRCELRYYVGDTLAKSEVWPTYVADSIGGDVGPEPPDPALSWVDQVVKVGQSAWEEAQRAEHAAIRAEATLTRGPKIGENGTWLVYDSALGRYTDTGVIAKGTSPRIGSNGHWFVGDTDTGVTAQGPQGERGLTGDTGEKGDPGTTPHIGENGNWFIGDTDTGVRAEGKDAEVDDTLTRYGMAADAAVTGDELYKKIERADLIFDGTNVKYNGSIMTAPSLKDLWDQHNVDFRLTYNWGEYRAERTTTSLFSFLNREKLRGHYIHVDGRGNVRLEDVDFEDAAGRVSAIADQDKSSTRLYPSVKAVVDYVDAHGGGGGTTDHAQLTNRDAADQHPVSAIAGLQDALDSKTEKVQIDFDGQSFKHNGVTLNYQQLHDIHLVSPDFAFVVYGDRAYLLSYVQDDPSSMREMRWESTIATNAVIKTSGIYVVSSDGINVANVSVRDINSENQSNKVSAVADADKTSTSKYPSIKAMADYVDSHSGGQTDIGLTKTGSDLIASADLGAMMREDTGARIAESLEYMAEHGGGSGGGIDLGITGAAVGQIAKINAVDAAGKPTAWEPVEMPQGSEKPWAVLQDVTLDTEVSSISIDLKTPGYKEYRIMVETPAPGESSSATIYIHGWMWDKTYSVVRNTAFNGGFWDTYPGANKQTVCAELMQMPSGDGDFVALRAIISNGTNLVTGRPMTMQDTGWCRNPQQNVVNSEVDSRGNTPYRGFYNFKYDRKCVAGTHYQVWGR